VVVVREQLDQSREELQGEDHISEVLEWPLCGEEQCLVETKRLTHPAGGCRREPRLQGFGSPGDGQRAVAPPYCLRRSRNQDS
jgi:hypothetical protein